MNFTEKFEHYIKIFEDSIPEYLNANKYQECGSINDAMLYSLKAGGKRIRPVLTLSFCEIFGGDIKKAMPFAAAIEMVHTYSLIHDDLPCMDNDDYRRGKLTNHMVYGEAAATLAGDALLTKAFEIAAKADAAPETAARCIAVLAECAGNEGMIGGQIIDIENEERQIDKNTLILLHSLKTSKLLQAACVMGAACAGADDEGIMTADEFGYNLGLAFQITDDILDVKGDFEKLGKKTGSDIEAGKCTSVSLFGLAEAEKMAENYSNAAKEKINSLKNNEFLMNLCELLLKREN